MAQEDHAETCAISLRFLSYELVCFLLHATAHVNSWMIKGNPWKTPEHFDEFCWDALVALKWNEGIKIGALSKRQVHAEADAIAIPHWEGMQFAKEVAQAVLNRSFPSVKLI